MKAMREAMVRAVPTEQRDKLRRIYEGFLGPMINYSAELFLRLNAFLEWKDKDNERLKHAWAQIQKTYDAITGETTVQRRNFETQINALFDKATQQAEDLVKLGQALEQESVARDAMRRERDQALLDGQRWREGFEASEKLRSDVALAQKHLKEALDEADVLKAEVESLKKSVEDLTLQLQTPRAPSADEVVRIEQKAEDRLESHFFEAFELMVDEGEAAFYQERFMIEEAKKAGQPSPELDVTPTTSEEEENEEVAASKDGEAESKETPVDDASLAAVQERGLG
ncbi:uncharacterized protein LOC110685590 [Chenopodium quinoa]|uniref:uncharacterized protein LOC110685590 n=1 Tax=Chenopodium quinoa TaxID=63459 RepID=UPI000B78EA51|nr:uncharacterized protein LOC110685590 [Chenopodium quinoa]